MGGIQGMKSKIALLLILGIFCNAFAEDIRIDPESNGISLFSIILGNGQIKTGNIQFINKGLYYEYLYKVKDSFIKVLSFPKEKREMVWINSTNPEISVLGISIGSDEKTALSMLGSPTYRKEVSDGIEYDFYGKQYMLMIKISKGKVVGLFYNPFE
jgi:hypothetical protein